MDRAYLAGLAGVAAFVALFAVALTPLMHGLIGLGLDTTAAALLGWVTVILVPVGLVWLIKDA
jgi:hypothetical protein